MPYDPLKFFRLLAATILMTTATSVANADDAKILVLGDSISAAYGMSLEQGWVALLHKRLQDSDVKVEVVNASISGETSEGGLRRLPDLLGQHKPSLLVIQLGGNDGLRGYPIYRLRENLAHITTAAQKSGAKVLLLPMEIPPNYGVRYTTEFRASFSQIAEQSSSYLGPFILEKFATDPAMMQADGIHPVPAAQEQMLDTVFPAIAEAMNFK